MLLHRSLLVERLETWQARSTFFVWNVDVGVLRHSLRVVESEAYHDARIFCLVWGATMEGPNVSDDDVATFRGDPRVQPILCFLGVVVDAIIAYAAVHSCRVCGPRDDTERAITVVPLFKHWVCKQHRRDPVTMAYVFIS